MPHTEIRVSLNINMNSHSPKAYGLQVYETDNPPTERLAQVSPVFNNRVCCQGVFSKRVDAFMAVLDYIDGSAAIVETESVYQNDVTYSVEEMGAKAGRSPDGLQIRRIVASRSPKGTFIRRQD
jgi:hypothetical protein